MKPISLDGDRQIVLPGLHDARVESLSISDSKCLSLGLVTELGEPIELVVLSDAAPHVWGAGVIVPNIVSAAWLTDGPPTEEWLRFRIGGRDAARALVDQSVYVPGGWLLAIEMNYAGPIVIVGRRGTERESLFFKNR